MKIQLSRITGILSSQDYLTYERLLDEMLHEVKKGNVVVIEGSSMILSTTKEVDDFNRKMVQVHGIYGLI
ncbi:hypothetical protein PM10SUCC1_18500 [Propionigenium maris DSM 9537]|uniref:Uncharacterized protein n=1 Tax=Propionigenium maris DSM 9537 TaxID=1123000 RepID=A0A9W6GM44_9FUSO|nr:hypothetical protein [Propionigenium maris]GLI56336.1 hypothetical protein PM10SUCC1_18500 [Propionigenium maris DSM 9537]